MSMTVSGGDEHAGCLDRRVFFSLVPPMLNDRVNPGCQSREEILRTSFGTRKVYGGLWTRQPCKTVKDHADPGIRPCVRAIFSVSVSNCNKPVCCEIKRDERGGKVIAAALLWRNLLYMRHTTPSAYKVQIGEAERRA
jgi:hypothetical protein